MAFKPSDYFGPTPPRPAPVKVTDTLPRRSGKTALQWHRLRQESAAAGRPIICVRCLRPYQTPPAFGACACGSYGFGIQSDQQLPLELRHA